MCSIPYKKTLVEVEILNGLMETLDLIKEFELDKI